MMAVGRLAPVPDRFRCGPSEAVQHFRYLLASVEELDRVPQWRALPPDYDRKCYLFAERLRAQASHIIQAGCGDV